MFLQFNNRGGFRPYGPGTVGPMNGLHAHGFSFDDGGMDEYDVADERAHLWEYINPDNMTYEEMIANRKAKRKRKFPRDKKVASKNHRLLMKII